MPSYSKEEDQIIKRNYAEKGAKQVARNLAALGYTDRTSSAVKQRAKLLGLKYTGPKLGLFKKGNVPANKGKKMPDHIYEKVKPTMFKKGCIPHNRVEVGTTSHHESLGYTFKKTDESQWDLLHRSIWEKANGPIPDDHIIIFEDGNTMNCQLSNLRCISRTEHAIRNNFNNLKNWAPFQPIIKAMVSLSNFKKVVNDHVNK